MGPHRSTALGILVGLNVFLAMAMVGVIAVNGANNPGIASRFEMPEASAAAGATSPELDMDGDGHISLAEAAGHGEIVVRFDRADRNRDGKLSTAEFERLAKLPPPKARKPRPQVRRDADAALAAQREAR